MIHLSNCTKRGGESETERIVKIRLKCFFESLHQKPPNYNLITLHLQGNFTNNKLLHTATFATNLQCQGKNKN